MRPLKDELEMLLVLMNSGNYSPVEILERLLKVLLEHQE